MNLRVKTLKSGVLVGGAGVLGNCLSFVYNMILARLLTKADFGIAATFALIIMLLEFSTKLGVARFVVQDREGDQANFIAAAHLMQFLAGALGATMMVTFGPLLTGLFGISALGVMVQWLALVALFRGLEHMDIVRFQRDLRFGPATLAEIIPQVLVTLAAWPVGMWLNDFRAVLVLVVTRAALSCLMSHLLAERPYRWRWHRAYLVRMLRFGWPLLATGFLMVGAMQGEQFLVASFYSMSELGPYAAAAGLAIVPSLLFGRVLSSLGVPLMAKVQGDQSAFLRRYKQTVALVAAFSVVSTVGIVIGSEALMRLVYGSKYAGSGVFLAWLATTSCFRNLRMAPTMVALAKGDSQNQLISNLWRLTSLLLALTLAVTHQPVWMLACCGVIGEVLGCWASVRRLRRRDGVPISVSLVPTVWLTALVTTAGLIAWASTHQWADFSALAAASLGSLLAGAVLAAALPDLRRELRSAWEGFHMGGWREACYRISGHLPVRKTVAP